MHLQTATPFPQPQLQGAWPAGWHGRAHVAAGQQAHGCVAVPAAATGWHATAATAVAAAVAGIRHACGGVQNPAEPHAVGCVEALDGYERELSYVYSVCGAGRVLGHVLHKISQNNTRNNRRQICSD